MSTLEVKARNINQESNTDLYNALTLKHELNLRNKSN